MSSKPYFIIGFGVFGMSAAFHLLEATQDSMQLIISSHHVPMEPSDDISKIIRIDYTSIVRMKEAIRAQDCWKSDQRFAPFYQRVGRIVAYGERDIPTLNDIDIARSQIGREKRTRLTKDVLEGFFGSTGAPDGLTFVYNEDDGVVEWAGCVQALKDLIKQKGQENKRLTHLESPVQILRHEGRQIHTMTLANNDEYKTNGGEIILTAGPWITEILQKSGIAQPPQPRALVATGIFAFTLRLSEDQISFFKGKPSFSHIGRAEFVPPTKDDGIAKITWIAPFTNAQRGSLSYPKDVSDSSLAIQAMLQMRCWALEYLPKLKGAKITRIRSYWDGVTSTQTPLLSRHPDFDNLFIAGGGSYTRAKDLPIIGKSIVEATRGTALGNPGYGWDPDEDSTSHDQPHLLARGNFEALELEAKEDPKVCAWRLKPKPEGKQEWLEEI